MKSEAFFSLSIRFFFKSLKNMSILTCFFLIITGIDGPNIIGESCEFLDLHTVSSVKTLHEKGIVVKQRKLRILM